LPRITTKLHFFEMNAETCSAKWGTLQGLRREHSVSRSQHQLIFKGVGSGTANLPKLGVGNIAVSNLPRPLLRRPDRSALHGIYSLPTPLAFTANTSFSGAAYRARSVEFMRNWPHPLEALLAQALNHKRKENRYVDARV
jgi:hypothetical protein